MSDQVTGSDGRAKLVMSTRGWGSLGGHQRDSLSGGVWVECDGAIFSWLSLPGLEGTDVVLCSVDTIERVGGGGVRCMLAPVFNISRPTKTYG